MSVDNDIDKGFMKGELVAGSISWAEPTMCKGLVGCSLFLKNDVLAR